MPQTQTKKRGPGRPRGSAKKAVVKSESESSASADSEEEEVVTQPAKRGRKPAAASTDKTPARQGMFCLSMDNCAGKHWRGWMERLCGKGECR